MLYVLWNTSYVQPQEALRGTKVAKEWEGSRQEGSECAGLANTGIFRNTTLHTFPLLDNLQVKILIAQADAKGKKKEETKAAPKVDAKVDEASNCRLLILFPEPKCWFSGG